MRKKLSVPHMTAGACYYPEHWDKSMWAGDLKRMKELGIEVIRIAEFAWNKFEPTEGNFTFDFFDEFMTYAADAGIRVIFCTPTATPPAWMSEKYPEILNQTIDGDIVRHGTRRHYNINSEKYRFFSARITEQLARHYGDNKSIVAWQLDNEINCERDTYYSPDSDKAFREFLKRSFKSLDALNTAAGTVFWNQTYTSWDEIHLTRRTNQPGLTNPHMSLFEKRFISDSVISFFKQQADIIRKYSSAYITTNGVFRHIDYHRLVDEVLDFITYDNYPNFAYEIVNDPASGNGLRDRNASYNLTRIRSISPIFGIMEQQSGPSGWTGTMRQPAPKPGQVRLWTLQAAAHGADFISYFRWRSCRFGTEMYWHGIFDYDNIPNRRSAEIKQTVSDLKKINAVCGTSYAADAAILRDYDNEWDGETDRWHGQADDISYDGWFCALQKKHIPYDMVYINDDTSADSLKKYRLVIYPHPSILTEKRAAMLRVYAENGGTLILGARTGYKDINGACVDLTVPGPAGGLCGARAEDFTLISPFDGEIKININGKAVPAPYCSDVLAITDGECVGTYVGNYYSGKPAVSHKSVGKGNVYYFGAAFSEAAAAALTELCGMASPAADALTVPESVELAIRGEYIFLLNYDSVPKTIETHTAFTDILTDTPCGDTISLPPYGAAVLRRG